MERVLFVHMPLAVPSIPSLAAHLLAAIMERDGLAAEVFYGTTRLKRTPVLNSYVHGSAGEVIFTPQLYRHVSAERLARQMVECKSGALELRVGHDTIMKEAGEACLSSESWPITLRPVGAAYPFGTSDDELLADILTHMELAGMCIAECLADIPPDRFDIFAFSVAFDAQRMASLALAKRLKERQPGAKILFGGTACDGEMGHELMERFPFIDVVSQGDADLTVVPLIRAMRGESPLSSAPSILYREGGRIRRTFAAKPLEDLDWLPLPDYTQFLGQLEASDWRDHPPFILFESSRGCWWGEKHHCKFCGLRADGLAYRRKGARRAREELDALATRHPDHVLLYATDAILDHRYLRTFFPDVLELAKRHKWRLFFEVKSNLKKQDVALLAEAGVATVQPGIESFSDRVLDLMDKGCTGLKQVQLIKWLAAYKINIIYNFIVGTPGERPEDYQETLELVPLLTHLPPPEGVHGLSLDRFSPYFNDPAKYQMSQIRPREVYNVIYPDESVNLSKLAYKFTYHLPEHDNSKLMETWTTLARAVDGWREKHAETGFWWRREEFGVELLRYEGGELKGHKLFGLEARLFEYCDAVRSMPEICKAFPNILRGVVQACLQKWVALGWMYVTRAGLYLALPVELTPASAGQ